MNKDSRMGYQTFYVTLKDLVTCNYSAGPEQLELNVIVKFEPDKTYSIRSIMLYKPQGEELIELSSLSMHDQYYVEHRALTLILQYEALYA